MTERNLSFGQSIIECIALIVGKIDLESPRGSGEIIESFKEDFADGNFNRNTIIIFFR
jgi:hypothetical protein